MSADVSAATAAAGDARALEAQSAHHFDLLPAIDADLIEPKRLAGCVIDQLIIRQRRPAEQRWRLSAREALHALRYEAWFVAVAAENLAHGLALSDDDRARLLIASGHVEVILAFVEGAEHD